MTNLHIKIIICNLGILYLMNKSLFKQIKIKNNTLSDILFNCEVEEGNQMITTISVSIISFILCFIESKIGILLNNF